MWKLYEGELASSNRHLLCPTPASGSDIPPCYAMYCLWQAKARCTYQPFKCILQQVVWNVWCTGLLISTVGLQPAYSRLIGSQVHIYVMKQCLLPAGVVTTTPAIPEYSNCYIPDPQPVYQVPQRPCPSAAAATIMLIDVRCLVLQSRPPCGCLRLTQSTARKCQTSVQLRY